MIFVIHKTKKKYTKGKYLSILLYGYILDFSNNSKPIVYFTNKPINRGTLKI